MSVQERTEAAASIVSVAPVEGGWAVTSSLSDQPLMFLSGAQAEAKARSLAKLIAAHGGEARMVVHDRRNVLVGAVRYLGDEAELFSGLGPDEAATAAATSSDRRPD